MHWDIHYLIARTTVVFTFTILLLLACAVLLPPQGESASSPEHLAPPSVDLQFGD